MNLRLPFIITALAAVVSAPIAAQTATPAPGATSATPSTSYRALRASNVIGMSVRNLSGESLGKISDMVVDMNTGDVRYAILQFDPGIFSGERLFAVPTTQLRMADDRDDIIYNLDRTRLERAASNRSDWDRVWAQPGYLADLDKVWGVTQPSRGARAHRVSDLLDQDVKSRQGDKIGEIEELVINMARQKVHYAVLEFDPSLGAREKFFALPLSVFNPTATRGDVVLDVDRTKIQAMKAFPVSRYTSLNDPAWLVEVDRYFVTVLPTVTTARTGQTGRSASTSQPGEQAQGSQAVAGNTPRAPRADRN